MTDTSIVMGWVGDGFTPANAYFAKVCDGRFVIGERYVVTVEEQRSWKSHRHYFATLNEVWKNWPETAERHFDSTDHLRKWALIRCGYRNERQFVASTKAEALRFAAFLRFADDPIKAEDYIEITVRDRLVVEWRAKSQSAAAMGKEAFAKSKDDVLSYLAEIIGTTPAQLQAQHAFDQVSPKLLPSPEPAKAIEAPQSESKPDPDDLTIDEAISILWRNDAKDVHNLSLGGMMIGATWAFDDAVDAIRKSKRRTFSRMRNHELLVIDAGGRQSLFETDSDAVDALRKLKSEPSGVASRGVAPPSAAETTAANPPSRPPGRSLTPEEAISLLPDDGEPLRNLRAGAGRNISTDWNRNDVETALKEATDLHLGGQKSREYGVPLCIIDRAGRKSFFEADMAKVERFEREVAHVHD